MEEIKSISKAKKRRKTAVSLLFPSISVCYLATQTVTPAFAQYSYGSSAAYGLVRMVPMMLTRAVRGSQNPNRQNKNNNNQNQNQNQNSSQNPNMQNQQGQQYPGQNPYGQQQGFNNNNNNVQGQGQMPYGQQSAQGFPQQQNNQNVYGNVQGQNLGAQGGQAAGSSGGNATFGSGQQSFQGVPNGQTGYPGQAAPNYGAPGAYGQQAQPGAF